MVFIIPQMSIPHTSSSSATSGNLSKSSTKRCKDYNIGTGRKVESDSLNDKWRIYIGVRKNNSTGSLTKNWRLLPRITEVVQVKTDYDRHLCKLYMLL